VDGKMYPGPTATVSGYAPFDEGYDTSGSSMVFDKDWTARVRKAKTDADISTR
jgi:hypothetical protein